MCRRISFHLPPKIVKEEAKTEWSSMTVKELKAYAEEKGIALDSRAKKADIIATIEAAEAGK